MIIVCSRQILLYYWDIELLDRAKPMIMTSLIGWLIIRYYDDHNVYYKIDVLTAYFIIWRIIYLMWKWKDLELE